MPGGVEGNDNKRLYFHTDYLTEEVSKRKKELGIHHNFVFKIKFLLMTLKINVNNFRFKMCRERS